MLALVDLDGTLIDRDAGFGRWARGFVAGHAFDGEALAWLRETDRAIRERGRFFTVLREHFVLSQSVVELWDAYRAQMPLLAPAFPGVLDALAALRASGWWLTVLTNGRVDNQMGKMRASGILDLLDSWCISEEAGTRKPDPGIFATARERLGMLSSTGCWVVGDDPVLDIAGGQLSGMSTIWVSHGRLWPATEQLPDRIGHTPAEALALLLDA